MKRNKATQAARWYRARGQLSARAVPIRQTLGTKTITIWAVAHD